MEGHGMACGGHCWLLGYGLLVRGELVESEIERYCDEKDLVLRLILLTLRRSSRSESDHCEVEDIRVRVLNFF
jgi:hypothetical protein